METVLRGGLRARGAERRGTALTAYQLLGGNIDAPVRPSEIDVPLEMVADLYAYPLIITPDYVGADRRVPLVPSRSPRGGRHVAIRSLQTLAIVLVTLAVAVPLTLMASHAALAVPSGHPPASSRPPASSPDRTLALRHPAAGRPTPSPSRGLSGLSGLSGAGGSSRSARAATSARLAQQRTARRTAARAASAAHQRLARAARVRHQEAQRALRHTARARRLAQTRQARTRRRP